MSRPAQWKAESSLQNCGNFPTEHVMPRAHVHNTLLLFIILPNLLFNILTLIHHRQLYTGQALEQLYFGQKNTFSTLYLK